MYYVFMTIYQKGGLTIGILDIFTFSMVLFFFYFNSSNGDLSNDT